MSGGDQSPDGCQPMIVPRGPDLSLYYRISYRQIVPRVVLAVEQKELEQCPVEWMKDEN